MRMTANFPPKDFFTRKLKSEIYKYVAKGIEGIFFKALSVKKWVFHSGIYEIDCS